MVEKFDEAMANHIMTLAVEDDIKVSVNDGVDFDWYDWDIEYYNTAETADGEPFIEVEATQNSYESEKVRSATRYPNSQAHPAEYKNHDVTIVAFVRFYPNRHDGFGECVGRIEQEGGVPSEPVPEPY